MRRGIQLAVLILAASIADRSLQAGEIQWRANIEEARQIAAQSNRLVLIHFWSPTCAPCQQLDAQVYNSPGIGPQIEASYVPVKINATENQELARGFGVFTVPSDVIIAADGTVVSKSNCPRTRVDYLKGLVQVSAAYSARTGAGAGGPLTNPAGAMDGVKIAGTRHVNEAKNQLQGAAQSQLPGATGQLQGAAQGVADVTHGLGDRYKDLANTPRPGLGAGFQPPAQPPIQQPPIQQQPGQPPIQQPLVQQPPVQPPQNQLPPFQQPYVQRQPRVQQPPVRQPLTQPAPGQPPVQPGRRDSVAQRPPAGRLYEPPVNPGPQPNPPANNNRGVDSRRLSADLPLWPRRPAPTSPSLDGTCPVELVENERWIPGDPRWGAIHRGKLYFFSKEEHQKRFMQQPDYYSPALAGNDPVLAIDQKQFVPGHRKHGLFYEKRVFLFSSEQSLAKFFENPLKYVESLPQQEAPRGN